MRGIAKVRLRMPKLHRITAILQGLLLIPVSAAHAGDADRAAPYHPPTGFNGLSWEAPLTTLQGAKLLRASTVTDARGNVTRQRCTETPGGCASSDPRSDQDVEGAGSFAVAEYSRDPDSNPWATSLVALHSASYLFCDEGSGPIRADVKQHLRFCGARIFYRSETTQQLDALPAEFESNHARVLRHLLREHGPYDGYRAPRGSISAGEVSEPERERADTSRSGKAGAAAQTVSRVIRLRWCAPADRDALLPDCPATITLLFIPDTGWGMVLFATDGVYKLAGARHALRDENNDLYMALLSPVPDQPTSRRNNQCIRNTGSLVCQGRGEVMSEKERQRFEP